MLAALSAGVTPRDWKRLNTGSPANALAALATQRDAAQDASGLTGRLQVLLKKVSVPGALDANASTKELLRSHGVATVSVTLVAAAVLAVRLVLRGAARRGARRAGRGCGGGGARQRRASR